LFLHCRLVFHLNFSWGLLFFYRRSQSRSFSVTVWEIPPGRRCRPLPLRPLPLTHCTSTRPHGLNFCVSGSSTNTRAKRNEQLVTLFFHRRYYREEEEENRRFASRKIGKKNKVLYNFCFPTFSFLIQNPEAERLFSLRRGGWKFFEVAPTSGRLLSSISW
jgi:hypothetical protein